MYVREALMNLLEKKGIITREVVIEEIQRIRRVQK